MPRMADLADDEHVQRTLKRTRDFGGDDDSAARQTQHEVNFHSLVAEQLPEFAPGVFPRCKHHGT